MRNHPHFYYFHTKQDELREMYLSVLLRSFSVGLVVIFIPIYLLKIGYSFSSVASLFVWDFFFSTILVFFFAKLVAAIGPKKSIIISYFFTIISFFLLLSIQTYEWPFFLIGLFSAIAVTLFWLSYHIDFSTYMRKEKDGKEVGVMFALIKFSALLAPFVGGVVATYGSIYFSFIVSCAVLFIGILLLLLKSDNFKKQSINFQNIKLNEILGDIVSCIAVGIETTVYYFVWPLLAYFFIKEYVEIGFLTTAASVLTVLFILYVGKKIDIVGNKEKFIKSGGVLNSFQNIYRIFATTGVTIFSANLFSSMITSIWQIPWTARVYEKAEGGNRIEYLAIIEIFSNLGRLVLVLTVFCLSFLVSSKEALIAGLILASIASLGIKKINHP